MQPFPDEWQLIHLFEAEPTLTDEGVPWSYNRLEFATERPAGSIRCPIEPGYETLRIPWARGEHGVVDLDLSGDLAT